MNYLSPGRRRLSPSSRLPDKRLFFAHRGSSQPVGRRLAPADGKISLSGVASCRQPVPMIWTLPKVPAVPSGCAAVSHVADDCSLRGAGVLNYRTKGRGKRQNANIAHILVVQRTLSARPCGAHSRYERSRILSHFNTCMLREFVCFRFWVL
jgi:hypothetical protein